MRSSIYRVLLTVIALFTASFSFAQDKPGLDGIMRGSGKIYVVVAGCLVILTGLFIYVFIVDRKVSRLEKEK